MSLILRSLCPTHHVFLSTFLGALLLACQGQPAEFSDGSDLPEPTPTIMEQLVVPTSFAVASTEHAPSGARCEGRPIGADASSELELGVLGGYLQLRATPAGLLVLEQLEVDFSDAFVEAQAFPPNGAHLTGIRLTLDGQVAVEPLSESRRLVAVAYLDLVADWGLNLGDGRVHPLNPVRLGGLPFSVEIERLAAGQLRARLVAFADGQFWSWANRFELSNLTVDLAAHSL